MTFRIDAVRQTLAEFEVLKIDIDQPENRDLCRQYHRGGGVPTMVLIDDQGVERNRWVGALTSSDLIERLRGTVVDQQPELDAETALFERCSRAKHAADWQRLDGLSRMFAATFPESDRRDEVALLQGIARFELDGERTPELTARIDSLIATVSRPFPGNTLSHRIARLLGQPPTPGLSEANTAWVKTTNAATRALADLGRPAREPLHQAMLGDDAVGSDHAATALGRMRLSDTPAMIIGHVTDTTLSAAIRGNVIDCLGMHADPKSLDTLIARLADTDEALLVRRAAADAIKDVIVGGGTGHSTRPDVARAFESGLESNDAALRHECLQAMFCVRAPLDLELLLELLSDRRPLFLDYEICDNAMWILLDQIGKNLVGPEDFDGRCSREVAAFLRGWHVSVRDDLVWDGTAGHYVVQ